MDQSRHSAFVSATFFFLLAATWFIYQPAISGPFLLDDFDNLGALDVGVVDSDTLQQYLDKGKAGPLGRPIAKLSFLLDDNAWPSSPENFKRTNLYIHLLIGVILFIALRLLARQLLNRNQSDWFALLVTALFLVHPIQVSTVMYVVQRMTQLSALFVLLGVVFHLYVRSRIDHLQIKHLLLLSLNLVVFTLLAAFSKESGVLLPVFLLVIEVTIFSSKSSSVLFLWWRRVCLQLPTIILLVYLSYFPKWMGSYAGRDFTLLERLLTQPVILWDYIGSIISMRVSGLGLFQDDYPIYSTFFEPVVLVSVIGLVFCFAWAVKCRRKYPLVSFGILWFLAGHILESTTVSLELYFEHRNYLLIIGPLIVVFSILGKTLQKISSDVAKFSPVFAVIVFLISSMSTWGYANEWSSLNRIIPIWAAEHPDSPRAQRTYAQLLASMGLPDAGLDVLDDAYKRFPYDMSIPVMSIDMSCVFERKQRYEFEELARSVKDHSLTDGLRPVLQSLFRRIYDNSCKDQIDQLHAFIEVLPYLQKADYLRSAIAVFFVLDGDLYVKEGNGDRALRSYQIVDQILPSVDSALRITGLLIRVKDFQRARQTLQLALERDRSSRLGVSSKKEKQYAEKFEMIDRLESMSNSQ